MKTIIRGALALALSLGLSLSAFAALDDNSIKPNPDDPDGEQEQNVPVSVAVAPYYVVNIPAIVELSPTTNEDGNYSGTASITAHSVLLEQGKQLNVWIEGFFKMTLAGDEDTRVAYQVAVGDTVVSTGERGGSYLVTTFSTQPGQQRAEMVFSTKAAPAFAGTYTDTVTFTIAVADSPRV